MSESPENAAEQGADTLRLLMDIQSMIVAPAPPTMLGAVARTIGGARTARVPVV
jgi:hypothetical protein